MYLFGYCKRHIDWWNLYEDPIGAAYESSAWSYYISYCNFGSVLTDKIKAT